MAQAKDLLKKSTIYIDNPYTDPTLLSVCLNNLALLHARNHKLYKSLRLALKAIELMETHIRKLKLKKDKPRIIEDAVILISVTIQAKSTLAKIMKENPNKIYRRIYDFINYIGYRNCLKYLGKDSRLIKRFTPVEKQFHLPVFKQEETPEEKKEDNENEKLILKQLENIYDVLKTKQSPEMIVVNTHSNIYEPKITEISESEHSIHISNEIQEIIMQQPQHQRMQEQQRMPKQPQIKVSPPPAPPLPPSPRSSPKKEEKKEEKIGFEAIFLPFIGAKKTEEPKA